MVYRHSWLFFLVCICFGLLYSHSRETVAAPPAAPPVTQVPVVKVNPFPHPALPASWHPPMSGIQPITQPSSRVSSASAPNGMITTDGIIDPSGKCYVSLNSGAPQFNTFWAACGYGWFSANCASACTYIGVVGWTDDDNPNGDATVWYANHYFGKNVGIEGKLTTTGDVSTTGSVAIGGNATITGRLTVNALNIPYLPQACTPTNGTPGQLLGCGNDLWMGTPNGWVKK